MTAIRQTLADFVNAHGISMVSEDVDSRPGPMGDDRDMVQHWHVTLVYGNREMSLFYSGGELADEPTTEDVLSCVASDATDETFDDWCSDFGYDTDSRRALATYEGCREQTEQAKSLLGATLYAKLMECEQL